MGERCGKNLTLAVLWPGQACWFAKHKVYWGQIWEGEVCCADVHVWLYLKLYECGHRQGCFMKANFLKSNFGDQNKDYGWK